MKKFLMIVILLLWSLLPVFADELSMKAILGERESDKLQFKQAIEPRTFHFPSDHLPHPEYKTEWWYFTGNLSSDNKQLFAYQFTLFRVGLPRPKKLDKPSKWRSNNIYMLHLALTDVSGEKIYQRQAMSRDGLGLAGVAMVNQRYQIWLDNWKISSMHKDHWLPLELIVTEKDFSLKLQLTSAKPIILQGNKGLSQKSPEKGNASYYYSLTRMPTQGAIQIGNKMHRVNGNSWFDREWSTSSLAANQQGWDWFAMQLDNDVDIMLYQLRLLNGVKDSTSYAVMVDKNGKQKQFTVSQFQLQEKEYWRSPDTKIKYPIRWHLQIPSENLNLSISPLLKQQEWTGSFKYWEGAIKINGHQAGKAMSGKGYLEMTGYD